MATTAKRATARRCKARNARGEPCKATIIGRDGLCPAHANGGRDMRELGRAGGKARRKGAGERLPAAERESLRDMLRRRLDPEKVQAAIEQSLSGSNEAARIAAVKFLADLELYKQDGETDYRAQVRREMEALAEQAGVKLEALVVRTVLEVVHGKPPTSGLSAAVTKLLGDQLTDEERTAAAHKLAREKLGLDVDETKFRAVLQGLFEIGLLRPGDGQARAPGRWGEEGDAGDAGVKRLRAENERLRARLAEEERLRALREEFEA